MTRSFRITMMVLLCVSAVGTSSAHDQVTNQWATTWAASPVAPVANAPTFNNQTLRLIVHTSVGGDALRIRLTNPFGSKALEIGGVSIGLQEADGSVQKDSLRLVKFGDKDSTLIPPGAVLVSDVVSLKIKSDQSAAISIFLPKDSGPLSAHPGANQNSYVSAPGNFISEPSANAFTTVIQSWPLLAALEVRSTAKTVVTFGDSITDGFKSTISANRRWPDYFAARLRAAKKNIAIANAGISGNRILHDALVGQPRFGPNALSRFDRDALAITGATHMVVLIGINDIGMGSAARNPDEGVTAEEIIAGLRQLALRAHAQGLKVFGATLTPFSGAAYFTDDGETKRQAVNAWIRTTKDYDGWIDFDRAIRDPNKPVQMLAAYDSGDHLHPNDAGYEAMAKSVDLKMFDR